MSRRAYALGALVLALAISTAPTYAGASNLALTGYVEGGNQTSLVARFAASLTYVGVDGVTLNSAGDHVLGTHDPQLDALRAASQRARRLADVLVSNWDNAINDFSPAIAGRLLSSPTNEAQVARELADFVTTRHWNGATVDLESLSASDGPGLVTFLRDLRADLPTRADLSVDVSATTSLAQYRALGYELGGIARYARVVLMAYDDHGPTWSGPGPIGPLAWQRASLVALLQRVPASDVDLGMAGYGYTWPPGARSHDGVTLSVAGARRLVNLAHASAHFDAASGEWTAHLPDGTVVWWSDSRSLRLRVALASQFHLHGLAVWELSTIDSLS